MQAKKEYADLMKEKYPECMYIARMSFYHHQWYKITDKKSLLDLYTYYLRENYQYDAQHYTLKVDHESVEHANYRVIADDGDEERNTTIDIYSYGGDFAGIVDHINKILNR